VAEVVDDKKRGLVARLARKGRWTMRRWQSFWGNIPARGSGRADGCIRFAATDETFAIVAEMSPNFRLIAPICAPELAAGNRD
jgi:hypothetical protein